MKDSSDNVHYIDGGFRFGDGVRKLHQRAKTLRALELESGSAIEYSGTNNFTMDTGIVYGGLNEFSLAAYNSATTQFTYVYDDGGTGWTETGSKVIDFAHYDDGDGTLGNVGVARYGVHYVYKHIDDDDVYVVYGTDSYTLAEAEIAAIIPPTIPNHLTDFGCQIGTIIAPQAGGSFTAVIMVTSQFFSGTEVANHANLANLDYASSGHTGFQPTLTNSAGLRGALDDETGTGKAVFGTSPTFTTKISTPQVTFPAEQSTGADANTLDDYEEGTWTPTIAFGGNSVGQTYNIQIGEYTKMGRQVTATCRIIFGNKGTSTGIARVTALPFTCKNTDGAYSAATIRYDAITFADFPQAYINKNTDYIDLEEITNAGVKTSLTEADFTNDSRIVLSITYFTD